MVREDLPIPQQAVQACHAAIKSARVHLTPSDIESPNLVVCTVKDEAELLSMYDRVRAGGVSCSLFREEDLGDQATAFATGLVSGADRRLFRKQKLLRGRELVTC